MATNIGLILKNLLDFYEFTEKIVVAVGAGGGQLADFGRKTAKVIAVDNESNALEKLKSRVGELNLADRFELVLGDFAEFDRHGDTVFFEFSLHEMDDPEAAVFHALKIAPEVVVLDHLAGSEWAYCTAEEEKVSGSWRALNKFDFVRYGSFLAEQHFAGYDDLYEKVKSRGDTSISRIEKFRNRDNIRFPMPYALALIRRSNMDSKS
jgi:ubiquinone/menaquinone biosynthesis C-methylase UbiE